MELNQKQLEQTQQTVFLAAMEGYAFCKAKLGRAEEMLRDAALQIETLKLELKNANEEIQKLEANNQGNQEGNDGGRAEVSTAKKPRGTKKVS